MSQDIVFGWTEFDRHKTLSPFTPTVFIKDHGFIFLVYNPGTDALMDQTNLPITSTTI